jgi:hypothetical protein
MDRRHAPRTQPTARTRWLLVRRGIAAMARALGPHQSPRIRRQDGQPLQFHGQIIALTPHLENGDKELSFTHRVTLPDGKSFRRRREIFQPPVAARARRQHLFSAAQRAAVGRAEISRAKPSVPVRKLSHRLLLHLRKTQSNHGVDWEQLCVAHRPRRNSFLNCSMTRCACGLLAKSERDKSVWFWNGHEWVPQRKKNRPRRQAGNSRRRAPGTGATQWLRKLDWFTPEPGLWIGDANENFLGALAEAWASRRRIRNFSATRRFTVCSLRRASSSRN